MPNTEHNQAVAPPRFPVGHPVRVKTGYPQTHCRTPFYYRGSRGVIERYCGMFSNPELIAHGNLGPPVHLYRVRSRQSDVWPNYDSNPRDTIEVEVYEHWLESDIEQ